MVTFAAEIDLDVNGEVCRVEVRHHWTLLRVLRESLGLTGAKRGCDRGECGSCTVLLRREAGVFLPDARDAGGGPQYHDC